MFTVGIYVQDGASYNAVVSHTKNELEVILHVNGTVVSAYKKNETGEYSFNNSIAKKLGSLLVKGIKSCTSKNNTPMPFVLGAVNNHEFVKYKKQYTIKLFSGELAGAYIYGDTEKVELEYVQMINIPKNIEYIKLTSMNDNFKFGEDELDSIPVRSVQEIALEKEDITWLKNKKYYVVNDDATAEKLFEFLDNYNGFVAYDTETTGLKINCFGKIGSEYQQTLKKYNEEHPDEKIRADKLVGIIFCVEPDVSYYFPCGNRKFKNLYEDKTSEYRRKNVQNIKAKYTLTAQGVDEDMRRYVLNTPEDEISCDVILMERVRHILETRHLVAHNGTFEWKVGYQYGIDTNIKDDTMIMHQIMYKFRSTTSNAGEKSNLKFLSKRELGIDQWELSDFFPNYKEDDSGKTKNTKKKKKAGSTIDFSYMDYEGTKIYAPTDGDATLQLFFKYKKDMVENHKEMEYIYQVEMIVSLAIAYMEFFGHRIDENKIEDAKYSTIANSEMLQSEIRQEVNYSSEKELEAYRTLKDIVGKIKECKDKEERSLLCEQRKEWSAKLKDIIDNDEEHPLNLASPAQVADLFFNKLKYPMQGDKPSVAKNVIKALLKERDKDGNIACPVAHLYSKYKSEDTLLTKFFGALGDFMYPGGFIFSSYGQIAAATGRMSCKAPNAQQYPKVITKIVVPREGYVMADADYSQIEYRVLTALAKNTKLAEMFSDPDSDYHTLMASLMFEVPYASVTSEMRSNAKSFNFGIPYGMGYRSLSILLTGKATVQTIEEAKEKYEQYFKNQPMTRMFFDNVKESALVNKYTKTLFNRYRYYSFMDKDGNISNAKKAAALRQAGNAVIQGCLGGDTRIQTKDLGIVKIKDVAGSSRLVWDGEKWSHGDILYSGKKQKCIVKFSNGQSITCSPIHKFLKAGTDANNINNYIECKELKPSDMIDYNTSSDLRINRYEIVSKEHGLVVESVEITDEWIDMYDVCNTDGGYYVADGIITHNTAADIFKIGVARNFSYIRENGLLGKVLIVNMVHDEQLIEIDAQSCNVQRVIADIGKNMQFKIDGFPPLYIGAGVGKAWGYAKGKMAEIHPNLLEELTREAENMPILRKESGWVEPSDVVKYFDNRVLEFRRKKVADYLSNPDNWNKDIHPAIGGLINLQFNYGRGDEAKKYVGPNGEKYTDAEFLELNIADFLKENNIEAEASWFKGNDTLAQQKEEEEQDKEYEEDEDEELADLSSNDEAIFSKVDESNLNYGASVKDLIKIFGACLLAKQRICGVDIGNLSFWQKEKTIEYLSNYACEECEDSYEIVFLTPTNTLNYTGIHIKGLTASEFEAEYKLMRKMKGNELIDNNREAEIENRKHA